MAEAITQPMEKRSTSSFADYAPTYGAAAALVLLILANVVLTPNFADVDNFRNILVQVTPTMLVAIGMTFVIATGGIDLSVGSLMAIVSAVAAISLDYGAYPAMLAALVVVTLIGAFNGWLISTFKIQPIIVTLAVLIAGRGVAQVISNGGQLIPFSNPSFEFWGKDSVFGILPVPILVMALIVGLALLLAVVGNVMLSVAAWRSGVLPRWAGALWGAATIVFYVLGAALGMATTGASLPTQPVGAALLAISGGWMAWSVLRQRSADGTATQPSLDAGRSRGKKSTPEPQPTL